MQLSPLQILAKDPEVRWRDQPIQNCEELDSSLLKSQEVSRCLSAEDMGMDGKLAGYVHVGFIMKSPNFARDCSNFLWSLGIISNLKLLVKIVRP